MEKLSESHLKETTVQLNRLRQELGKVLVGQNMLVERMLAALLTGGHVLLEGVPGLAKSLAVNSLAKTLGLSFSRIQFTPDLLPADLTGTLIYNQQLANFQVRKGPVFAHMVLADEINRAPAKVQSALLEAMQEKQVTIGDTSYPLPRPFMVLATQNPIDQEGTYLLPEAQMDRFLFRVQLDYPSEQEELQIMQLMAHTGVLPQLSAVLSESDIQQLQQQVNQVRIDERIERYILRIVRATRDPKAAGVPALQAYVQAGASPRGSISLSLAVRAQALLQGRDHVLPEDVKALAADTLNHRLLLSYEADADAITGHTFIQRLLDNLPI